MISVLIPTTTGGLKYLVKLIPQLKEQVSQVGGEILVSCNGANDGTEEFLRSQNVFFMTQPRITTFSQANNRLFEVSKHNPLLLNNDTEIPKDFISTLIKQTNEKPQHAIFGCAIYRMVDKRIHHAGVYFTMHGIPYELGLSVGDMPGIQNTDPRVKESREVPSVTGACMLIRREVYKELGGLGEMYKTSWEDTDFVLRAREKGYTVWYTGDTQLYHHHFGSKDQGRLTNEAHNRQMYDQIWVNTGRIFEVKGIWQK